MIETYCNRAQTTVSLDVGDSTHITPAQFSCCYAIKGSAVNCRRSLAELCPVYPELVQIAESLRRENPDTLEGIDLTPGSPDSRTQLGPSYTPTLTPPKCTEPSCPDNHGSQENSDI